MLVMDAGVSVTWPAARLSVLSVVETVAAAAIAATPALVKSPPTLRVFAPSS
jgi:hypothetical protein